MTLQKLRNIGISAHIDSGKTTLAERMLFYCGRIHQMRDVRGGDGGATMDHDEIERRRGITIKSAATQLKWDEHLINVIDTPGHVDFTVEVERSLRVLDGAVMVLCSVGGVQSQSYTVDRQMRRYGVPRIALVNKMDRTGADPQRVIAQMRERLKTNAVAIQMPIGCGASFEGVIDLVTMKAVYFVGEEGSEVVREAIPEMLQADAAACRLEMLESLAMLDESLMARLLDAENPDVDEVRRVIRQATIERQLTPVLFGSAQKNIGVQEVLGAINHYLPAPAEREVFANDLNTPDGECRSVRLIVDSELPLVAMAFKTIVEPFGELTFLRIYQGRIEKGRVYQNARTGKAIRFGRLVRLHAGTYEELDGAEAGDIVGAFGVDCASGDTLVGDQRRLALENIVVAEPVVRLAIEPQRREDSDKLAKALDRLRREDPTFRVMTDADSGETLIAGMGQLHLEVYVDRIESEFECPCIVGKPSVTYKSRPTRPVEFKHTLSKQTGGPGVYAQIVGRMTPLETESLEDESFVFESRITGGRIAKPYIPAVRKGIEESLVRGPLGGCEVVGVGVTLEDGDQHENDSSDLAFRLCAKEVMRDVVLPDAGLVLMEPIMKVDVDSPEEFYGAVTGYLARKRGIVVSSEAVDENSVITAEVPLAELFDFASDLRSMTQGKGTFTMQPLEYRDTPPSVQDSVLAQVAVS